MAELTYMDGLSSIKSDTPALSHPESVEENKADDLTVFFTLSPEPCCILDSTTCLIKVNYAFLRLLNYVEGEVISKPFTQFVHPEAAEIIKKQLDQVFTRKENRSFQTGLTTRDGRICRVAWLFTQSGTKDSLFGIGKDISDKIKEENHPLRYIEEIDTILDSITDGLLTIDRDWKVMYGNKIARQITGIAKGEGIGKSLWEIFPEGRASIFYNEYSKAFQTQQPVQFESFYEPLKMWFEIRAYPTKDLLSIFVRNITDRKLKDEEIKSVNERYNMVAKATSEAIWDMKLDERKLYWHGDNLKNLFGYEFENNISPINFWSSNVHPEDRRRIMSKHLKAINSTDEYWSVNYRFRKADGEYAYVQDRAYILRNEEGKAFRMIGAMEDITAQKLAEDALMESEKSYKELFNNAPLTQWIYDVDTLRFLNVNQAAIKHYGYSIGEFLNMTLPDVLIKEEIPKALKKVKLLKQSNESFKFVWTHVKKNGECIIAEISSCPILYKGKNARLTTVNDITEKLKLEEKITKLKVQKQQKIAQATLTAQENERIKIGKELHDNINQVLTTTKLYLELARSNEDLRMNLIERSENNLISIINEIRKLSRDLTPPTLQDVGLKEAIQELIESYTVTRKFTIQFACKGQIEKLSKEMKLMVFRIIQEQLTNIAKYAQAKHVFLDFHVEESLYLQIKDDGQGFDVTAKRKGLGISNIINRAELYNGHIAIESSPGNGCVLTVTVPLHDNK